jgi:hypothetical protein
VLVVTPCIPFRFADGSGGGFVCTRGGVYKSRCVYCGRPATLLCDGPPRKPGDKTCDRAICKACATPDGPGRDLCRHHAGKFK